MAETIHSRTSKAALAGNKAKAQNTEPDTDASVTFHTEQDDEDELRTDTLYEATDLRDYIGRRADTDDISDIKMLLTSEEYQFFKFEDPCLVFEKCCFSVAISDVIETDRIVAAGFFDDKPIDSDLKTYAKTWKTAAGLEHLTPLNTFYMHLYAGSVEVQSETLLTEVIAYTFAACHSIEHIIVELPNKKTKGSFVFCNLVKEVSINTAVFKKAILIYEKDLMFPTLKIREGREHDLDDLAPLLPMDSETIAREFGKAVLSDIIALSDKNNQSMVAEWNTEAVGIISVSTDIDYEMLNKFYHLEPFHGLFKPHMKDEIEINYDETEKILDVPIDEILEQARIAMETLKSRARRRPIEKCPYTVERVRGDDNADDSDASGRFDTDEMKSPETHQFGLRVSDDILIYGLRSQSSIDSANERPSLTACMRNFDTLNKSGQSSQFASDLGLEEIGEDVENEEEEGEGESEESSEKFEEAKDDGVLEVKHTKSVTDEWEETQLQDFYAEFIGEGIDYNSQQDFGLAGDANNEISFDTEPKIDGTETEQQGSEEEDSNTKKSQNISPIPSGEVEAEEESQEVSPEQSLNKMPGEVAQEVEEQIPKQESQTNTENESIAAVSLKSEKAVTPSVSGSGRKKSGRLSVSTLMSSSQSMAFFQNKDEFQRRLSDDTIYLGKTGTNRTFEEKVELMKKVWEVYQYIKEEGLNLDTARMYLSPKEMEALDEAEMLTKGNILRFFTPLIPDEKLYPFDRPVKPKVPTYHGIPNALAIKLFNIEKKFSLRSLDLFRGIFKLFPNREYLIATVPQGSKEPGWLDHFVRVVPRVDSSYPRELFVLHKIYLTSSLKVRRAKIADIPQVIRLVATLKEHDKILENFKRAVCCKTKSAFVVEVKNLPSVPIIGMAVASDELQSQSYHVNYCLDKHSYYHLHEPKEHAYMHHLIIYPIFQRFSRTFVKEIMRMMDKTCMFHKTYPPNCVNEITKEQSLLNNLDDWIALMPRKRVHYNYLNLTDDAYDLERRPPPHVLDYTDSYSVLHFGKKFTFDQKISINLRIVFVGASETTLSCIEKMISSSFKSFKRLTIIDPYGLPGELPPDKARDKFFSVSNGGKSMSFESTTEWVQRIGIKNWVNVVLGWVTKINRDKKYVVVDKEKIVPFDILVLATGLQFQRPDCPEPEIDDPNFIAFKQKTNPNKRQGKKSMSFKRETAKPKNVFTINAEVEADMALSFMKRYQPFMKRKKIVVFGGGLRSIACVNALLTFGIPANRIILIHDQGTETDWELRSGYTLTSAVKLPIEQELKRQGVTFLEGYEFHNWETCTVSGLVKRIYFSSRTETEAKISISTFCIFCFRYRRVNDDIVSALSESYIVYQDGVIVDENFKTNDPNIYAAGPGAVYRRMLLAVHQDHRYYQSEEIGFMLAEFLFERSGTEGGGAAEVFSLDVIPFKRPFVRAVVLLGWHYLYMRSPGAPVHMRCFDPNGKCDEACECSTEIVTGSVDPHEDPKQRYFKIRLDDQSRVVGVECMSKKPFSASNLVGLYGQHEVILNKMMERLEKGETKDLFDHFCQPWFGVFCLDHWETFNMELQDIYKKHDIGDGQKIGDFIQDFIANLDNPDSIQVDPNIIRNIWDRSGLKQTIELKFLDFLKFHRLALPMYARNDYVEDLLEERSTSTLYYPSSHQY